MDILKHYIDTFNADDNELYKNDIDNSHAYEWLKDEIPLFTCPDKDLERTYYFRFWTYRKHLRSTDEGYVITEFLPNVGWAGKYNTINAAFGFHLCEGRWLKNADKYLGDYTRSFLRHPESSHRYSVWFADAVLNLLSVTGNTNLAEELLPGLCEYYSVWERTHKLENGMFYSIDNYDAMEFSISGTDGELRQIPGIRPTLNSYMCADAYAIARLAALAGDSATEKEYTEKHTVLRGLINGNLYKDGFYRAFHGKDLDSLNGIFDDTDSTPPRELIGYIPWMFNIPTAAEAERFDLLASEDSFYTEYGPATAERSHPRFLFEVGHECLWNGYVWPFATSQTLYALRNAIDNYGAVHHRKLYRDTLKAYAASHTRALDGGRRICWIDESRHPFRDEWYSRECLIKRDGTSHSERGKDYNHSSFCDHIITGIVGVKPTLDGGLTVKPNIPEEWDYFSLTNLHFKGRCYDINYDRQKGLLIAER